MSIGFAADVRDMGDAYPTTILGDIPVVMVRDEKGALRVFHNVCPRDGCLAVWSPKKSLSMIVGAYHGWVWNLDGTLTQCHPDTTVPAGYRAYRNGTPTLRRFVPPNGREPFSSTCPVMPSPSRTISRRLQSFTRSSICRTWRPAPAGTAARS